MPPLTLAPSGVVNPVQVTAGKTTPRQAPVECCTTRGRLSAEPAYSPTSAAAARLRDVRPVEGLRHREHPPRPRHLVGDTLVARRRRMSGGAARPFVHHQWYVAAYGREVGREIRGRAVLGSRSPPTAPRTARPSLWPTAASTAASRCRRPGSTATRSSAAATLHLRQGRRAVHVPARSHRIPRTARFASCPWPSSTCFVWVWIGEPDRAERRWYREFPGSPTRRPRLGADRAARGARESARRQPRRAVARELPARRLHWRPRSSTPPSPSRLSIRPGSSTSTGTWTTRTTRPSAPSPRACRPVEEVLP